MKLKDLEAYFVKTVKRRDEAIAKFKAELDNAPFHAMVWAAGPMQEVARGNVAEHYLRSIANWREKFKAGEIGGDAPKDEDAVVEMIHQSVIRQALQRNTYVERSTSITSNFMKAEENAFYAYLANDWGMLYV